MPDEKPETKESAVRLRTGLQSVDSTDPSALQAEVLLMTGRVKKRSAPALDEVPTGLLGSGQAAANVTLQVYPDIWRHGTSTAIQEDQRTFQSRRGTRRRHKWQDHFLVMLLSNVSLEEPGTDSKEQAGFRLEGAQEVM